MNINNLFPNNLVELDDYQVLISLLNEVSSDIRDMIKVFPEIVDVNNAPELFLPKLSALIKYKYRYDISADDQRDIISRFIEVYRNRGTDDAIVMAATYGDYEKWAGGHLFYPDAKLDRAKAKISTPAEYLFTHDKSKFSGEDRFTSYDIWREGTLILNVKALNQDIIDAVAKVTPAGLKILFQLKSSFDLVDDDNPLGTLVYGNWTISHYMNLKIQLVSSSMKKRAAKRSDANVGKRSSNYVFGGLDGVRIIELIARNVIHTSDDGYQINIVEDMNYSDYRKFKSSDAEINILKLR